MALMDRSLSVMGRVWRGGRSELRLYLLSVFSLAVAFVCLASALLVVVNLHAVQARWARAGRMSIYLRDDTSDRDLTALRRALEQTPGIVATRYVSPADARRELAGDGLTAQVAALPTEAFPPSIELTVQPDMPEAEMAALTGKLRALPSVDGVETYQRWTEKLGSLLSGGVAASVVLALVVLGAVVSVIASTMRLALNRRRIEIEVLKLVGATDRFVRGPFIVEGAAQGAFGAAASLGLLGVLYLVVRTRFDEDLGALLGLCPTFLPWEVAVAMVVGGGVLGALAAFAGVRKLLTV
jgi:cell division transport system permease protein